MAVITISRETGSGAREVGQKLAEQLGALFLDTQVITEVARRLEVSEQEAAARGERDEDFITRVARTLSVAALEPSVTGGMPVHFESTDRAYVEMTRQVVREAAATGNAVILGHGAQFILADQPDVLHVRCVAPLDYRVSRAVQRLGVNQQEALRRVRDEDHRRRGYIQQYYRTDLYDPTHYHLLVNTARLGAEACVRLIREAVSLLPGQEAGRGT